MAIVIRVIAIITFLLGVTLIAAGPGVNLGAIELSTAFAVFQTLALPAFAAAAISFVSGIFSLVTRRTGLGIFAILAAFVAAGGGYIPAKMKSLADANPFIHDITTDFENPPQILALRNYRAAIRRNMLAIVR